MDLWTTVLRTVGELQELQSKNMKKHTSILISDLWGLGIKVLPGWDEGGYIQPMGRRIPFLNVKGTQSL